jgi:hypothetical protein
MLSRKGKRMPWGARFQSLSRLKDWLGLLGFDTLHSHYLFQRPPVQNKRFLEKLYASRPARSEGRRLLSATYILVARKRTVVMTPILEGQPQRRQLFPVGIPSSRQGNVRRVG